MKVPPWFKILATIFAGLMVVVLLGAALSTLAFSLLLVGAYLGGHMPTHRKWASTTLHTSAGRRSGRR